MQLDEGADMDDLLITKIVEKILICTLRILLKSQIFHFLLYCCITVYILATKKKHHINIHLSSGDLFNIDLWLGSTKNKD